MLEEIAKSWEETSLKSPQPLEISLPAILFLTKRKLQRWAPGWDFTVRQTQSFTGQTAVR